MFSYRKPILSTVSPLLVTLMSAILILLGLEGCGTTQIDFAVTHLRDRPGEQITETVSYLNYPALDNSAGSTLKNAQVDLARPYSYQIKVNLASNEISKDEVVDKLVKLYKLPPNDPEGEEQTAKCALSTGVPPGQKASIVVEWTERWADGLINKGTNGEGDKFGDYAIFLGYLEPCSLIDQTPR